jgi:transcriptional regulator with PAS, ATPase and Fis domain
MVDLNGLKKITQELAEEIHNEQHGKAFEFIRLLFDHIESFVAVIDDKCNFVYINPAVVKFSKDTLKMDVKIGDNCQVWAKGYFNCDDCIVKSCINQRRVLSESMTSPHTNIKYWRTCIPLAYDGVAGVIEIVEKVNG